jgi:AGCS family alanine or glycine:cation symporter
MSEQASQCGVAGYSIVAAMRAGVARGLMSNEAGQGTTPIVHATAQTDNPASQGALAALGVFIDTIIVCSMTALVILSVPGAFPSGHDTVPFAWMSSTLQGGAVTGAAFDAGIAGGRWIVAGAILLFAFTTLTTWHYYAEQALAELVGPRSAIPFRLTWVLVVFVGGLQPIDLVWRTGDLAIALMTIPNLLALVVPARQGQLQPRWLNVTALRTERAELPLMSTSPAPVPPPISRH